MATLIKSCARKLSARGQRRNAKTSAHLAPRGFAGVVLGIVAALNPIDALRYE
jgi:hypothetical protein